MVVEIGRLKLNRVGTAGWAWFIWFSVFDGFFWFVLERGEEARFALCGQLDAYEPSAAM